MLARPALFFACPAFVYLAIFSPATVRGLAIPVAAFGTLGLPASGLAMWNYIFTPADKIFRWYRHMGRMPGRYTAAGSAFSVNIPSRYPGNNWRARLWPTVLGVPAIIR